MQVTKHQMRPAKHSEATNPPWTSSQDQQDHRRPRSQAIPIAISKILAGPSRQHEVKTKGLASARSANQAGSQEPDEARTTQWSIANNLLKDKHKLSAGGGSMSFFKDCRVMYLIVTFLQSKWDSTTKKLVDNGILDFLQSHIFNGWKEMMVVVLEQVKQSRVYGICAFLEHSSDKRVWKPTEKV
ncbi:hypothetical protein SADUNF_Sadunf16G0070200 [Salix dunnii]|uniref:Uncharacterized protein n=1 Tax=Salix dunnii TaxID=1413687 RepID=A0A835J8H6_9ROSI|nr:hypothetical protein SADUNF_Sadunf16G0070200 [Salix dunnii]